MPVKKTTTRAKKPAAKKPTVKKNTPDTPDVEENIDQITPETTTVDTTDNDAGPGTAGDTSATGTSGEEDINASDDTADTDTSEEETGTSEEDVDTSEEEEQYDTIDKVKALLALPDMSNTDKLNNLANNSTLPFSSLTNTLLAFDLEFGHGTTEPNPDYMVGKLFNLYNTIRGVVVTVDDQEFRVKMDILNLVFMTHGDEGCGFNDTKLLRYDYLWKWGDATLKTHQVLCTVISKLADLSTRAEAMKTINFSSSLVRSETDLPSESIERLVNYYS